MAVAIPYVSTLLLELVDEKKVSLDDKLSKWLPDMPHADKVTLGQLAQMTSGYSDYVLQSPEFAQPAVRRSVPVVDPRGTPALRHVQAPHLRAGHQLGLRAHQLRDPRPRDVLHIPAGTSLYEESTFWNPSWTLTRGGIDTTNIYDVHDTAVGIGTGKLLSPESYKKMVSTDPRGKTTSVSGCDTCKPQQEGYTYGLGIVTSGNWLTQNPLFSGYAGAFGYHPSQKVAVAVTFTPDEFDDAGNYVDGNAGDKLWRGIAAIAAPSDPPPMNKKK